MRAVRAFVLCVVSLVALAPVIGRAAQQVLVFRAGVDLVSVGVTITDRRGVLVTDLTVEDFEIIEDGKKQTITSFSVGRGRPGPALHLGVLLDVSESMGEDLAFTKTAAVRFLNTFTDAVDITIVDFDTEVRIARYSQRDFARVVERIRGLKTTGDTALYDAIGVYLDAASGRGGRQIMLLYTDGGNTRSAMRYGELMDLLRASDVTVYAIGQVEHQPQSARTEQHRILQQVSETTGGQAFFPTSPKDLEAAYDMVSADIHAQYLLGYQSTNRKADGSWRKVEMKVVRGAGGYRLRSRKGYFASDAKP